jgi:cold shock CspA family protein
MENKSFKIGIIKWFDSLKGFGIVGSSNNGEYFLHQNNFKESTANLKKGSAVCFIPGKANGERSAPAINCRYASLKDIPSALHLLKTNRNIEIEKTTLVKGIRGIPYLRKEFRSFDILDLLFRSVIHEITFSDFLELLKEACSEHIQNWTGDQIINLVNILEISLKNVKFKKEKEVESASNGDEIDLEIQSVDLGKYNFIEDVINCLKNQLTEDQKFELWKLNKIAGYRDSNVDYYVKFIEDEPERNLELPFDSRVLEENFQFLTYSIVERLVKYSLSERTMAVIEKFFHDLPITSEDDLKKEILFSNLLPDSIQQDFRLRTAKKVQSELYLKIWNNSGFKIDNEKGQIKLSSWNYRNENDFLPSKEILYNAASFIDKSVAKRLVSFGEDGMQLLSAALLKIQKDSINSEKKTVELYEAARALPKDYQLEIILYFTSLLDIDGWKKVVGQSWIDWKDQSLTLLGHSVNLTASQKSIASQALMEQFHQDKSIFGIERDKIASIISNFNPSDYESIFIFKLENVDNEGIAKYIKNDSLTDKQLRSLALKIDFSKESSCIQILNLIQIKNLSEIEKLLYKNRELILKYSDENISDIFEFWPLDFLKKHILTCSNLTNTKILRSILSRCTQNELKGIKDAISSGNLSLENYNEIVSLFQELGLKFYPESYSTLLTYESPNEDVLKAVKICSSLSNSERSKLGKIFEANVEFNKFYKENEFIYFLKNSFTSGMQRKLILSNESHELFSSVLFYFQESAYKRILNDKDYIEVLKFGINLCVEHCLNFLISNEPKLLFKIIEYLKFSEDNIEVVFNFLDLNFSKFENPGTLNGDANLLIRALKSENEIDAVNLFNEFNELNGYAYQTSVLMLVLKLIHNNQISSWHESVQLDKCKVKQLGIILVKEFLNSYQLTQESLMKELNTTLKEHFKVLEGTTIKKNEFKNLFSIRHLVKKCNGRKFVYGLNHWKGGQFERYYSKGSYGLITEKYSEKNIYCEGRLWKTLDIWSSETNRPTGNSQTLYWCERKSCAGVNTYSDLNLYVSEWTLSELAELKSISIDRLFFTNVAGWLNRMKSIFDRLNCHHCNNILRPLPFIPKQLGFYAVPLFHCVNEKCSEYEMKIRFTHCRNCKKILDSRECKTCSKCNWLECNDSSCRKCGCGSSHIGVYVQ